MSVLADLLPCVIAWSGKIPPESTLTFIVEVLEIRNGPRSHESFQEMDLNDDWRLSKDEVNTRDSNTVFGELISAYLQPQEQFLSQVVLDGF